MYIQREATPTPAGIPKSQEVIVYKDNVDVVEGELHTSPQSSSNIENFTRGVTYVFRRLRGYTRRPH